VEHKDIEKRVRQWEAEGYDVSELKAKCFSTRRGNGPKRLLIALVVVAIVVAVLVSTRPQASFYASPTDGDAPRTVQFYDRSTGVVTGREWDFGDGSTSRIKNPSHIYTREGTYTVRLTVTGLIGSDTRTLSRHIRVEGQTSYNLRISSTPGGAVTTPGEGTFTYDAGTVVNLMAIRDDGYQFKNWTGSFGTIANVNAASTTITMNDNYTITASFQAIPTVRYNLSISSTALGSVTSPGEGVFTRDAGTMVNLVATAGVNCRFINWTGDVDTIADVNAASTTITMNVNYSVKANFEVIPPYVSIDSLDGPSEGQVNQSLTYSATSSKNIEGSPEYRFDWGEGSYSSWSLSPTVSNSWSSPGTYTVRAQARASGMLSDWSPGLNVVIASRAPQVIEYPMRANPYVSFGYPSWVIYSNVLDEGEEFRGTVSLSGYANPYYDYISTWRFEVYDPQDNRVDSQSYRFSSGAVKPFAYTASHAGKWKIRVSHQSYWDRSLRIEILPHGWSRVGSGP